MSNATTSVEQSIESELAENAARESLAEQTVRNDSPEQGLAPRLTMTEKETKQAEFVDDIANDIVDGLLSEGEKRFRVGRKMLAYVRWQLGNFDKFKPEDLDRAVMNMTDRVRLRVSISDNEIRVFEWMQSAELHALVAAEIGELADNLNYFEYQDLVRRNKASRKLRALTFNKGTVRGVLTDGWLGFIQGIAEERATDPTCYKSESWDNAIASHEATLAELALSADPAAAARAAALAAIAANQKKTAKVTNDVTNSINAAISDGIMSGDGIVSSLLGICKAYKQPVPKSLGVNPETATGPELLAFVDAMTKKGRWAEVQMLQMKLEKVIALKAAADSRSTLKMAASA